MDEPQTNAPQQTAPLWKKFKNPRVIFAVAAGVVVAGMAVTFLIIQDAKQQNNGTSNSQQQTKQPASQSDNADPSINPVQQTFASCTPAQMLTTAPAQPASYSWLVPMGNIAPPGHVFPTDHLYFTLGRAGKADQPFDTATVHSPGDVRLTKIRNIKHAVNGQVTSNDYELDFALCKEVDFEFAHLQTLSAPLQALVTKGPWKACNKSNPTPQDAIDDCYLWTNTPLVAGETLGTGGGAVNIASFDFGAHDSRTPRQSYANPDRLLSQGGERNLHVVCPLDYFTPTAKTDLQAKLGNKGRRTAEPLCGQAAQDKAGTAQGNWYAMTIDEQNKKAADWTIDLSLVHDNIDPAIGVIGIGGTVVQTPGVINFRPAHTGTTNREPSEITPGAAIYCYAADAKVPSGVASVTGHMLVQLGDAKTMKVEYKPGGCAANEQLANPTSYYR